MKIDRLIFFQKGMTIIKNKVLPVSRMQDAQDNEMEAISCSPLSL